MTEMMTKKKFLRIDATLHSLNRLYREIDEYNRSYWSKFLANVWFLFGLFLDLLIYATLFVPMSQDLKLFWFYYTSLIMVLYFFILSTVCSVNHEVNKSYPIVNSVYVEYSSGLKRRTSSSTRNLIKVYGKNVKLCMICTIIQLGHLIERLSKRDIGFSCWRLFSINYYKCYEVSC